MLKPTSLPDNIADLQALLSAQQAEVVALKTERDQLREEKKQRRAADPATGAVDR
jgi:hypothetical protein